MKNQLLSATIFFSLLFFTTDCKAQFTFSVGSSLKLSNANFGYKFNKFNPYLSLQVLSGSFKNEYAGIEFDFNQQQIVNFKDSYTISATAILPTLGLKYFFLESNKLRAYGNINYSQLLLTGKVKNSDPLVDESYFKNQLKKNFIKNMVKF